MARSTRADNGLARLSAAERRLASPAPPPSGRDAMLATLTDDRFSDPDWIFERKLDGIRCIAVRRDREVRLRSRNDLLLNDRFPEIADAVAAETCRRFAVDGELVAFAGEQTSFARLAQRGAHPVPVFFYVFDVLWLDGHSVTALPLLTRKHLLEETLAPDDPLRFTSHRRRDGEAFFVEACRNGWEGLIAKRADSPYVRGRSREWLKFKCVHAQELVIGGYTAPRGSRQEFGAMLLGYYRDGKLRYAGKVGTGFDNDTLRAVGARLRELARPDSPFATTERIRERAVTWVEPRLVAQIGFTEWTPDGRLRHPRFEGLREDKDPSEVTREKS